jgi:hypothetical protein|tara:strand:- start:2287 stop:2589 length:303 start_codon:yes stop_codon:yes gene_type:complete
MYERYTSAKAVSASQQNIEPHDAVLLTYKANGATQLFMYDQVAVKGANGRVMASHYSNEGKTGPMITIDAVAGDLAQQILPIQIKSTGTLTGHEVHILFK